MHEGSFEPAGARPGEAGSPLRGPGTVDITSAGLRVRSRAIRTRLVTASSVAIGFLSLVLAVVTFVVVAEELGADVPLKVGVLLGLLGAAGGFFGAEALLPRVLPLAAIDHVIPWSYLISGTEHQGAAELLSSDPVCPGRMRFRTPDPHGLLAALEHAKSAFAGVRSA